MSSYFEISSGFNAYLVHPGVIYYKFTTWMLLCGILIQHSFLLPCEHCRVHKQNQCDSHFYFTQFSEVLLAAE